MLHAMTYYFGRMMDESRKKNQDIKGEVNKKSTASI